ncbi:FecR family protein [Pedobacter nutrimenti]|uniref:FecR family protein n=1 Tax=Pedobacter nutrimenti TaxID=1241337 RepID=UPI0029300FAF|nr:FecR family protein [Pedobacter nutrimenti]
MTPEYDQNIDRIIYLLATKAAGELNAEELSELEAWKDIAPINRETADEVSVTGFTADLLNNWKQEKADHSLGRVRQQINRKNFRVLWPRIAAAAAVLLVVGLGVFFYTQRHLEGSGATSDLLANDIKPGGNKAYLVLSNGKRVSLTDAANGELAKEAGVEITKTADGQVIYTARGSDGVKYSNALNTIETPRGGQYQIRLPDGSRVWLNAASKLIYPVSFNGRGQRVVELSGEAYFEIFKNKLQPFVVKSKNQEVTVLGTHFNVNSYSDEPDTKTTLLEGSVRVSSLQPLALSGRDGQSPERVNGSAGNSNSSLPARGISPRGGERFGGVVLKPGEQSIIDRNRNFDIRVQEVQNLEAAVAWKNGTFIFDSEPIQVVMRKVARWYDVDVEYKTTPSTKKFTGAIARTENISQILALFEKTDGVKFEIVGRKIIVK